MVVRRGVSVTDITGFLFSRIPNATAKHDLYKSFLKKKKTLWLRKG
jgi:hypothetical protein